MENDIRREWEKEVEFAKCMSGQMYDTKIPARDAAHQAANDICWEFNNTKPSDVKRREELIRKLFNKVGKNVYVEPFIWVGFGTNIEVGDNFFANNCCNFMDPGKITFGNDVFVGANCGFYTAHHPIGTELRNKYYEWAFPITVGDNVWFGSDCTVVPGVTIGSNVVVAAGSVIVHDVPDNCGVAGNPAKVVKQLLPDGTTRAEREV